MQIKERGKRDEGEGLEVGYKDALAKRIKFENWRQLPIINNGHERYKIQVDREGTLRIKRKI